MWALLGYLLTTLLVLTSIFLILLILVQRGKGGGLVGALGGMGGQSAFGAKAGGIFWATSIAAGVWILLCIFMVLYQNAGTVAIRGASGTNVGEIQNQTPEASSLPATETPNGGSSTAPATGAGTTPSEGNTSPTTSGAQTTQGEVSSEKDFQEPTAPADK